MYSYVESRGGKYDRTVFFGLQYILQKYLTVSITKEMVLEAQAFFAGHGEPFPLEGWMYVVEQLGGKIPLRIRAVPEGLVVPTHNVLMTVECQDPKCFWLVSWFETMLMRMWYPITVATQSWHIKRLIYGYLKKTADNPDAEINFKLHDFGSRGVSSQESASIGGASHLVNFMGSDTCAGVWCANKYYQAGMAGFSIPAAEHSTITAWGKEHEVDAFRNMLTQFAKPGSLVAVVSDSYNLWNAVEHLWGEILKNEVINSGATVIIRPDSGNPPEIVLETLRLLETKFGVTVNTKGYKVLNNVRVIQGDGINQDSINEILKTATDDGYSATNIAFGMGGALLQQLNRDTQKFALKCSEITIDGKHIPVSKNPITDPGKKSKAGRLILVEPNPGEIWTVREGSVDPSHHTDLLELVYENGEIIRTQTLEDIRGRANKDLQ
jgi:nicotinamide phosphoribosyltransferase